MSVELFFTANPQRAESGRACLRLMDMAQSMGFSVHPLKEEALLTAAEAPEGMLVVVGGDGSLLRQVPAALRTGMPLWGVHGGTVGFLTESTEETFAKDLQSVQTGTYTLEARQLLMCRFPSETGEPPMYCLNDALLYKRTLSGVARIHIRLDGEEAGVVSGDGVIVSSPTGSTAYSLSCGGPVLTRNTEALVVTPVCPHNLHMRPVVAPFRSHVELYSDDPCVAVADGSRLAPMDPGSVLEISGSERSISFIRFGRSNLFSRIHERLT